MDSIKVKAYGGQYYQNVPLNLEKMEKFWNGGLKLWSAWKGHLPRTFMDAEEAIASAGMPIYTGGAFSRIILLGDFVGACIVTSPSDREIATGTLLLKSGTSSMRGLEVLGWEGSVDQITDGLDSIRHTLNEQLLPSVKRLFCGGKVGVFDVEHILCKVFRKQTTLATKSNFWSGRKEKGGLKRKLALSER
jgi:hypothetical protein